YLVQVLRVRVGNHGMPGQVLRILRSAVPVEVVRRRRQHESAEGQASQCDVGVGVVATGPESDIDAAVYKLVVAVGGYDFNVYFGVHSPKHRQQWADVAQAKRQGRHDAQGT